MRKTIRTFTTAFLIYFTGINAIASNFKSGYIITHKLDTIYGQINNGNYKENSLMCMFRTTSSDTVIRFTPDDLFGYRFIDGKFYVSKFIPQQKRTIFLEYLVKGSLDVYFQQEDDNVNMFYVAKDTLPLRLLKYEIKDIYNDGLHFQELNNMSQVILEYYTKDCPEMVSVIRKMKKPEHENMIKLATDYHRRVCPGGTCQVFEKKMPAKVFFSASMGIGYYPLPFNTKIDLIDTKSPGFYFSNAVNLLFQQSWVSESTYFGIGFADYKRIPVSLMHMPEGNGILPIASYEIDINHLNASQNLMAGIRLPLKKLSLILTGNLTTVMFVTPVATSVRFGVIYQLKVAGRHSKSLSAFE